MEFYGTLGDACWERETLEALFRAGMTGARLNLSHTTLEACALCWRERFGPRPGRRGGGQADRGPPGPGTAGRDAEGAGLPGRGAEVLLGAGDPCARRRVGGRPDGG